MPKLETSFQTQQFESSNASGDRSVRETRFDPPHEIARGDDELHFASGELLSSMADSGIQVDAEAVKAAEAILESMSAGASLEKISAASTEQFRIHAQQLVEHLDRRQRDLDRREAELHARLAQHESSSRNARLWFQERHHDLLKRQAELDEHDRQLSDRLAEFDKRLEVESSATQASLNIQQEQAQTMAVRQDELSIRELDLRQRQAAVEELAARAAQRAELSEQQDRTLREREESLSASEATLARALVELEDQRKRFGEERAEFLTRCDEKEHKLLERQRRLELDSEKQKEILACRYQQLEQRGATMDQLRSELVRLQQEALEMRLATEELWSELSGLVQPAVITQSLARLRTKLTENYRLQTADAFQQRKEAEELALGVSQQHERLTAQKREFETWIASQRREIEHQAANLAAREQELDTQRNQIEHQREQWDGQRQRLEGEHRRLQVELRRRIIVSPALA